MKKILDPCCGGRMFWFDKNNEKVIFGDIRNEKHILCDGRNFSVSPDVLIDFTEMPFKNKRFKLIVFDPPHLMRAGKNSWLVKKYGVLPRDWEEYILLGFNECWRVLDNDGILIFKWNETKISLKRLLKVLPETPLFGHRTMNHNNTIWMCFMKLSKPSEGKD